MWTEFSLKSNQNFMLYVSYWTLREKGIRWEEIMPLLTFDKYKENPKIEGIEHHYHYKFRAKLGRCFSPEVEFADRDFYART